GRTCGLPERARRIPGVGPGPLPSPTGGISPDARDRVVRRGSCGVHAIVHPHPLPPGADPVARVSPMTAKPNFQGLRPTGREMRDPAATLYELDDEGGRVYTSIVFDPRYHGEEALTLNVELVESFMEYPMVTGLVELARHDLDTATFSYPTGRIFTL